MPAAASPSGLLAHERHRKHDHARQREEDRRVDQLPAARLDRQILPRDDPHDAARTALMTLVTAACSRAWYRLRKPRTSRFARHQPAVVQHHRAVQHRFGRYRDRASPAATMQPADRSSFRRSIKATVDASSSPVKGSSRRRRRGWCSSARSSASRCRMPRENPDHGIFRRCRRAARVCSASAARAPASGTP